jgi:hypothetical protein
MIVRKTLIAFMACIAGWASASSALALPCDADARATAFQLVTREVLSHGPGIKTVSSSARRVQDHPFLAVDPSRSGRSVFVEVVEIGAESLAEERSVFEVAIVLNQLTCDIVSAVIVR